LQKGKFQPLQKGSKALQKAKGTPLQKGIASLAKGKALQKAKPCKRQTFGKR
jgi:hypothetical protein